MAAKPLPSTEVLRQLLDYDPQSGALFWRHRPEHMFATKRAYALWNTRFAGQEAFNTAERKGHLVGKIFGQKYKAHRVIWSIVHGDDPSDQIDHANGDPGDNRIANIREASAVENCRNRRSRAGSTSRHLGVSWNKARGRWCAEIGGRHLGLFNDEREAAMAYDAAARAEYGEFARVNITETLI